MSSISNAKFISQNRRVKIRQTEQSALIISASIQVNGKICSQNQCLDQVNGTIQSKIRLPWTPWNTRRSIRCLAVVNIPCWPVKRVVNPVSWSWTRSYPPSVCQVQSKYWHEKRQTTYGSMNVCNYRLDTSQWNPTSTNCASWLNPA
jgi:hypothetical protein